MKKLVFAIAVITGLAVYAFVQHKNTPAPAISTVSIQTQPAAQTQPAKTTSTSAPESSSTTTQQTQPSSNTRPSSPPVSTPTTSSTTSSEFKDGTYTGSSEDAFYGNVQVQAVISGGKLTNVAIVQYPNDRGNSIEINNRAIPVLQNEAIQAQSSNIDMVSGATQSSTAFIASLQSALNQAKS